MAKPSTKTLSKKVQGEETRATLIETGARLFAQNGYNGVSMRTLAAEAEVNLATVGYHFGGKAGLYKAILQNIINVRDELFPTFDEVTIRMDKAGDSQEAKGDVVDWFVNQLVRELLGHENYVWPAIIISRELAQPSSLYAKLEKDFFDPSFASLYTLAQRTLPKNTSHEEITISAHCIISMIIKLLEGHRLIAKRLGWESYADNLETVAVIMRKRIRGLLGLPMENA